MSACSRLRTNGTIRVGSSSVTQRIPDQLAGAVIGDVTAAVDVVQFRIELGEHRRLDEQVGAVSVPPHRVRVGVFEQQQIVVVGASGPLALVDGPLQVPRLHVRQPTEPTGAKCSVHVSDLVSFHTSPLSRSRPGTAPLGVAFGSATPPNVAPLLGGESLGASWS
jgi:hypothetical protein